METTQLLQLITAICFSVTGALFLFRSRKPGEHASRVAGILFLVAAAINWILVAGVFG